MELNVIEQCLNIFKTAAVQRRRVETFELREQGNEKYTFTEPRIHGFVYEKIGGGLYRRCRSRVGDGVEIKKI